MCACMHMNHDDSFSSFIAFSCCTCGSYTLQILKIIAFLFVCLLDLLSGKHQQALYGQ